MARFTALRPYLEDGGPLTRLAQSEGIALRTAQRWVQRYRAQGLVGLARRPRLPASAEHLNLLLLTVAKARRVHQDGIHFQGMRYLDLTLAAYVGEWVTIRYDPRDLAEIRVFHEDRFLCRAICPELEGTTIGLKDLIQARAARRRELRTGIGERAKLVELLLSVHADAPPPPLKEESSP